MPGKNKSRNNSRNNSRNSSRKSNASSEGKTPTVSVVDENEFASISITPKPPVVKKKASVKQEEPVASAAAAAVAAPVITAWEEMNMTESDFTAMLARVLLQYREGEKKDYEEYLLDELDTPSYWERQVETLETQREYFNKKRGWSAADIESVEDIDSKLKECKKELIRIEEVFA